MIDHLNLLCINIPDSDLSAILELFRNDDIPVNHQTLSDKDKLEDVLASNHFDLVILSESDNSHPFLNQFSNNYSAIPIIFFARNYSGRKAAAVMGKGAKDCVSRDQIERLIPIVGRELEHKKVRDSFERTKKFKNVLSGISDLSTEKVFIFDSKTYECKFTNRAAAQKSGYSKDEILSLKASDIYTEYSQDSFTELISPLFKGEQEKISICTNIKRKMGVIYPSETHFKKVKNGKNTYILATSKDISGAWYKVQKLKKQRSLTDKYIQQNKQKENLIANAAHDMRTSLNSIILSNKLLDLQNNEIPRKEITKLTQNIRFSGNHLIEYINEFFNSSEADKKIKHRNISLHTFGQQLYQAFRPVAFEQNIAFNYHVDDLHDNSIRSNRTYIKRILKNILSNAFKYTKHGSVSLTIYSPTRDELEKINFNHKKAVAFQVKDTGIGIPQSEQNDIFDRYQRSSQAKLSQYKGSGLGLDICKRLTNMLGGRLHANSKVNEGSTFTLYLPIDNSLKESDITAYSNISQQSSSAKSSNKDIQDKTILIVDDNKMHNLAMKEYLSYTFDNCITASYKKEIYEILEQEPVDCIILDFILFDTNSIEIASCLKNDQKYADIPIIIYTGKKLQRNERQKLHKYVKAIIPKNIGSHNKLVSTIHSYLKPNYSTN